MWVKESIGQLSFNPHKTILVKERRGVCLQLFKLYCKYLHIFQMLIQLYMSLTCGVNDILYRGDGSYSTVQAHNFQNDRRK